MSAPRTEVVPVIMSVGLCLDCGEAVSVTPRRSADEAQADIDAHVRIVHDEGGAS